MNILLNNPNFTRATSVLLIASLGAVGCGTTKDATIFSTEITPVTEIYEWPLERVEDKPNSGFELVRTINDDSYDCGFNFDGEWECERNYDDDYVGYKRQLTPSDASSSTTLKLDRREFVGNLETPPTMDAPADTEYTHYSVDSFYDFELKYTLGDSEDAKTCSGRISSDGFDETEARKALTGKVILSESWDGKSIQFKKEDKTLLKINC